MKIRYLIGAALLAFAVTLAVVVGQRLSSEAMAVVIGVIAGVAASIPTSLIVVWVATRSLAANRGAAEAPAARPAAPPQVIVVQSPAPAAPHYPASVLSGGYPAGGYAPEGLPFSPYARPARQFTVLGGDED